MMYSSDIHAFCIPIHTSFLLVYDVGNLGAFMASDRMGAGRFKLATQAPKKEECNQGKMTPHRTLGLNGRVAMAQSTSSCSVR